MDSHLFFQTYIHHHTIQHLIANYNLKPTKFIVSYNLYCQDQLHLAPPYNADRCSGSHRGLGRTISQWVYETSAWSIKVLHFALQTKGDKQCFIHEASQECSCHKGAYTLCLMHANCKRTQHSYTYPYTHAAKIRKWSEQWWVIGAGAHMNQGHVYIMPFFYSYPLYLCVIWRTVVVFTVVSEAELVDEGKMYRVGDGTRKVTSHYKTITIAIMNWSW